jgi:hypothetical protein
LLFALLAALAFGSHVTDGGFVSDDWPLASTQDLRGFGAGVRDMALILGSRPITALLQPARFALLGTSNPVPHLVLALALSVVTSLCLYALLRELRLRPMESGIIAALALIFPWADSIRLWTSAGLNSVAVILLLAGATMSLRSFRTTGKRATALAGAGTTAMVAGVLTYEVVSILALAVGALYLKRAPLRRALTRWAIDALAIGGAAVYSLTASTKPPQTLERQIDYAVTLAKSAITLAATAVVPVRGHARVGFLVACVVFAFAVWTARRRPDDRRSAEIRRLLTIGTLASVATAASYAPFVPQAYWTAWKPGLENRVNILACIPMVAFAYSIAALVGVLVGRLRPSVRWLSTAVTLALVLAIAASYMRTLSTDKQYWADARAEADAVLTSFDASVPKLPRGATVYVFGQRAQVAPGVHVFAASWDLYGAVRLRRHDDTLAAFPVLVGAEFECGRTHITPRRLPGPLGDFPIKQISTSPRVRYGHAFFFDMKQHTTQRPRDRAECRRQLNRLEPGSFR